TSMQNIQHHLDAGTFGLQFIFVRNRNIQDITSIGDHIEAGIVKNLLDDDFLFRLIYVADKEINISAQNACLTFLPSGNHPKVSESGQTLPMFYTLNAVPFRSLPI